MARVAEFATFMEREADWLDDYVLFRALRDRFAAQPWWDWPDGLSTRQPSALAVARRSLKREIRFHAYLQWLAHGVRALAREHPNVFPLIATRHPAAPWLRPPLRSLRVRGRT